MKTSYKGLVYPKFFRSGKYGPYLYESGKCKPFHRIINIPYLFALYLCVKPERHKDDISGYKPEVIEHLKKVYRQAHPRADKES